MVYSSILDTLVIAAVALLVVGALILLQLLIHWSYRKSRSARPELPPEIAYPLPDRTELAGQQFPAPIEQTAPPVSEPAEQSTIAPPTPLQTIETSIEPPQAVKPPQPSLSAPPTPPTVGKIGTPPRLGLGLRRTRETFLARIRGVLTGTAKLSEIYEGLEEALIGADVGVDTSLRLTETIRTKLKNESRPDAVREALKSEIAAILEKAEHQMTVPAEGPLVILIVGVNGVGKTTTVAKLAARFKAARGPVIVAAADTFRAAAIEQLEVWCNRAEVEMIKQSQGSDPAAVAFDAVKAGIARKAGTVLIDTAGRLQTKTNLMEELKKIGRVVGRELPGAPHEVWLVLDATTGQNALSQAKIFGEAVKITGVVLAKLDSTAKGGVIIGIAGQLGIPVRYVGLGEEIGDLREFDAREFVDALFSSGEGEAETANGSYAA